MNTEPTKLYGGRDTGLNAIPARMPGAPVSNFSLRTAMEALFRYRLLFTVVAATVFIVAVLATLLTAKQYASEAKFLVQNARENVVLSPERTAAPNANSIVSEEQVNSEIQVFRSRDVIEPVADPPWRDLAPNERTMEAMRRHEQLLKSFDSRLATDIVRQTNVIDVRLTAGSPEKARDDLERLSEAYLTKRRQLQRPAGASRFFASEAERIRKNWNAANEQLVEFQQQHELLSLPEREQEINRQISEGEEDLLKTDASLRELDARLSESRRQLNDLPPRQSTEDTVVPNLGSVGQLTTLLVQLKNTRTTLLTKFQPTDREVRELDQQIATTTSALDEATRFASHQKSTDVDPAWQQVQTAYVQADITRGATAALRAKLSSQNASLRRELVGLQAYTAQFDNLRARADELKANYQLYVEKRDQAQIEDAMDAQNLTNVAVVQQPTFSYVPVAPRRRLNMLLGFVTAAFLGICAVYFADAGRETIATPRELDRTSRYQVLATMPLSPVLTALIVLQELSARDEVKP
jgi:protein tyrosine kinase modulator